MRDRELRRQDPARGSATEMTEGPTKGPSDSRRETSAEDRCRTVVKVRCPSGYASIVELGFEKPQHKGSGVALLAGPSWEDIPSSRNLQQGAAPAFPVALTASAVCDKYLDDSKCMSLPGTKEMISIPCNNNREISQQGPVKEASPATTASVSESIPRRSKDAGIVGSPAGATHQSVIGLGSPQDQKLKVKRTEDLHANRSAKLKLPSESNTRGKVLGIQRIIPEEVKECVGARAPGRFLNLEEYFQSHIKAVLLPGDCARTHQYISSDHYKVKRLSDYVPDINEACGPISHELSVYECSHCYSPFALKCNFIFHLHKCSNAFLSIKF